MTKPTYDMARWSWFDYLKITRERGMYPLYNGYDVDEMSESIRIVKAGESLKLGPFDVEMRRAGHIAGAVSALVTVGKSGPTVFFSGDISARHQHTVEKAHIPDRNVDYLVIESTYGRKSEMNREEVEREIVQATRECLDGGGKVICPAFAIGRVPELFSIFKISGIADSYPLYIDGGGRDMSLVYVDHGLVDPSIVRHFVRDFDRQRIFETEDPLVVISPSGMAMDDTLSAKYIARWASNPKNLIKLVSYQDPCSPGSGLLSAGAGEQIYINREFVTCNARVRAFPFSAHADGGELAEIIERLKSQETFLVHGAEESMNLLAEQSGRKLTKTRINEIYSL